MDPPVAAASLEANSGGRRLALCVGLLTAAAAALYFFSFAEPWTLRGENKISLLPMAQDAWRQWLSGRFPAWTTGMWAGFPLFSGGQSAALYLPFAIPFALTPEPHWRAFDLALAMHAGWLAAGVVLLLVRLGARPSAAVFGALLLLQAPHVVWWTNFASCFVAFCWWPWLFLASLRLARPGRLSLSALVLGTVALAAQVFVGFAEFAFYSGCIAGSWIVTRPGELSAWRRVGRALLLGASAGLLSAPQLLPMLGEIEGAMRGAVSTEVVLGLQQASWMTLFNPFERDPGRGFGSIYLGLTPLVLACLALAARVPHALFLAIVAVVAGLTALGPGTPVHGLVTALPGFDLFRTPSKFFVITEFAVLALAALGLSWSFRQRAWKAQLGWALAALAAVEYATHFVRHLEVVALPHVAREFAVPSGLEATERFLPVFLKPEAPGGPLPRVLHVAVRGRYGSLGESYGIDSLLGSSPALLSAAQTELLILRSAASLSEREWLALMGVRYVVTDGPCAMARSPRLLRVEEHDGQCLLRNLDATPRFSLLPGAHPVTTHALEAERIVTRPGGRIPVVVARGSNGETGVAALHPAAAPAGLERGDRVRVAHYAPGRAKLEVTTARDRFLFVREARNGGWRARVDGRSAKLFDAGGLFFAVPVPPGAHEVELDYEVRGLHLGLGLAACWVVAVAVAAWSFRQRAP